MKRATKKFFVVFLAVLSVFLLVVNAYAKEPYKIGALFAVTGPASFLGEPEKNTALMLQEQINKAGGINGHPLEIIIEDTKSDETQAVLSDRYVPFHGVRGDSRVQAYYRNAAPHPKARDCD